MRIIPFYFFFLLSFPFFGQTEQLKEIKETLLHQQYEKGLELIKSLPDAQRKTPEANYYKAICESEKANFDAAILSATSALKKLIKTDSLYPDVLLLRSWIYAHSGKLKQAVSDSKKLIREFPENMDYVIFLSDLYGENRQYDKCIKILHQVLSKDSLNATALTNLSYFSNEAKDYNGSIKFATKGLTLTKDSIETGMLLNNLGFAQAKTISFDKGIQTINQSIRYYSGNSFAYYNLGLIYLYKKEPDNACLNFKKAK